MSIKLGNTIIEPLSNSPGIMTVGISGNLQASGVYISQLLAVSGDTMEGTLTFANSNIQLDINYVPTWGEGKVFYDVNQHTLSYYNDNPEVTVNLGQEVLIRARNNTGSTILNGKVVVVSGALGSVPLVKLADNASISSHYVIGVATHDINDNENGYITVIGKVNDIDTSMYSAEGVILWLGTNGGLTETQPIAPAHKIKVGYVVRKHATQGSILVNIDKGNDIEELHNVLITSSSDGDLLVKSGSVWTNSANISAFSTNSNVANISASLANTLVSVNTPISGIYTITTSERVIYGNSTNNPIYLPANPITDEHHWLVNIDGGDINVDGNGRSIWLNGIDESSVQLPADSSIHVHFNQIKNKWYII